MFQRPCRSVLLLLLCFATTVANDYGHSSGTKKEPKPKLFGPDIFRWGGGLPRERVGAKKFDSSLKTREIKLFGRDIPGFCRDIPGAPEKFEKKMFGFNFRSLIMAVVFFSMAGSLVLETLDAALSLQEPP